MKTYRLNDGKPAQAVCVMVPEQRGAQTVQVRKEVKFYPGDQIATTLDLSDWVARGTLVEVYDPAGGYKAAKEAAKEAKVEAEPLPVTAEIDVPVADAGDAGSGEAPEETTEDAAGEAEGDAATAAKAARVVRRARR